MDQGIKFVITGDTKGLENATKKAKKEVQGLGDSVEGTDKKAKEGAKAIDQVGESAKNMGDKAATGAKAITASFLGTGGVLAAFTAVVGIMDLMERNGVTLGDALSWLSGISTDAAKSQREFNEAIKNGVGDAQAEVITIQALVDVLQDENSTREEQLRAYNKINELQPSVLEGISLEDAATADLTKNVDALSESLIRQAKIKGAQDLISKEVAKILELESKSAVDAANGWDWLNAAFSGAAASTKLVTGGLSNIAEDSNEARQNIDRLTERLRELVAEDVDVGGVFSSTKGGGGASKDLEKELKRQAAITKKVNAQMWAEEQKMAEEAAAQIARDATEVFNMSGAAALQLGIAEQIQKEADESEAPILALEKSLADLAKNLKAFDTIDISIADFDLSGLDVSQIEDFSKKIEEASTKSQIFGDAVGSAFMGLAQDIAGSLETGNKMLDSFVGSIIQSLASMLASLAQSAIQQIAINQATATSAAIAGGAQSGAATGPAAIFSTPAFIATLVGVVAAAFAAISGGFAQGGIVGGGSFTGDQVFARLNSGERVLTIQDQGLLTRFLRGESLGTTNQTGGIMDLEASTVLRGSDIFLSWKRSERSNNRFFK